MMQSGACVKRDFSDHPCFYGSAKNRFGRIHLPVAPECNIQCNFCNRLYDCANENRPAVTMGILEPDQVLAYLSKLLQGKLDISVVGIAGPGDPLCDPQRTLDTIRAVQSVYPDLLLCISTNGLNLPEYIDDFADAGVTHMTVTVNAVDPEIGRLIYSRAALGRRTYRGTKAAECILSRQREAIAGLKARGIIVKINTVVIPAINTDHILTIAEEMASLGADIMNCIPVIPLSDTPFEHLEIPAAAEMNRIRNSASLFIPQMYHCQRCRADAVGLICSNGGCEAIEKQRIPL